MAGAAVIRRGLLGLVAIIVGCRADPESTGSDGSTGGTSGVGPGSSDGTSSGGDEPIDPFTPTGTPATSLPLQVVGVCPEEVMCAEVVAPVELGVLPEGVDELRARLVVHNIVQPDSAELALNGDDAVALAAPTGLLRPHGGVATGTVGLDPEALQPGTNWLTFRYTRQVPDVSGFRVLEAVLEADGVEIGRVDLPWSDPNGWQAPTDGAEDVELGRSYFTETSRDDGPVCAACHAIDGADLQYFAFSNHGIVERSRHHLFPPNEAEQIATYLRSLDISPIGRVYEPAFQSGEGNALAGGAGWDAVVDDDAFGEAVFGPGGWTSLPDDVQWAWALDEGLDLFEVPAPVQFPAWFAWLPRSINPVWFEIPLDGDGTTFRGAEIAMRDDPNLENAQRFMAFAVALGNQILAGGNPELSRGSDHVQRIQLLRFAAVRLWEWSRAQDDFTGPDRGFPFGTPPYPYEVGFAFFEAAQAEALSTDAWRQTMEWWWVQLSLDAGRGASNGLRPLDYEDVLLVAREAGLGPNALVFLHLYGSWEESRGTMSESWSGELGPVRLLSTPMYALDGRGVALLFRRFLRREAEWLAGGGSLEPVHHDRLADAWTIHCGALSAAEREELRSIVAAHAEIQADLAACP